ncbi:acyl-ACP desaturase [Streptomyces sp. A3M-1-3]|uniref:acyl-ACP desaturase n=1 Tax=Streptomyces sp. A3M-1-3 TaxID=2962044 RepID=UPI0020B651F4|nr:acyl-ACP desaturase [Streptomyces sp. A3M-1-3]MCP3821637.1 acyl-ACP desaturase [Streptomyces sp. A3M-1-3]
MELTGTQLLHGLEEVVERELNRHLGAAKEWFPHAYVPWSRGRDYDGPLDGSPWSPEDSPVSAASRRALVVNLLTEDNLPTYHHEIAATFGRDGAWGTWVHRWTAEEARHSAAIRDYLLASRAVDPVALERARMQHMSRQAPDGDPDVLTSIAYVAMQELATRISHRNTGRLSGDPVCDRLLARIATDENLHMVFYRNLLGAAMEIAPEQTTRAITDVIASFEMPGNGMPGFERASVQMALAGVYNVRIHLDEVVKPVLRKLDVVDRAGMGPAGRRAQDELGALLASMETEATRFDDRRATTLARRGLIP